MAAMAWDPTPPIGEKNGTKRHVLVEGDGGPLAIVVVPVVVPSMAGQPVQVGQSLTGSNPTEKAQAPGEGSPERPSQVDGTTTGTPIGIPTFEDKILQRAVVMVLEAVYEQEFLDCSFGFRPGRSAHQAVQTLWEKTMTMGGGWVLDLDIEKFFDTLDRTQLRQMLEQRIRDGVLLRLIGKWLNAGALDAGVLVHTDEGTPQGGVISPLLANLYLHVALDVWFETQVKPRLKGRAFLVRYADDAVLVFEQEEDARRVLAVLPKRFGKYGLRLHPEKTKLIEFRPPGLSGGGGGTFDFLSFTHHWGRSLRGNWVVKRSTCKSRFRRAVKRLYEWCREHRHDPVAEQHKELSLKLKGHYAYYGITGNSGALASFLMLAGRTWHKWLSRRSQRAALTWEEMTELLKRHPLPPTRIVHSYVGS